MSRIQLQNSWLTNLPVDMARHHLDRFLKHHAMTMVGDASGLALEMKQGSQFITRLLGGWFIDPKYFPKRAVIRLHPAEQGLIIEAFIEETFGLGYLDSHFKSRYEGYFHYWMNALRSVLPPVQ
jgi:hypothetical protein